MPWGIVEAPAQSWTTVARSPQTWTVDGFAPSAASRLNRVYQQSAVTAEDLSFIWRVQSEGPFYVASGSGVYVRSGITEPFA